jgi:ubiquinone/menaquinone biosynthesis C-methylase UbiE
MTDGRHEQVAALFDRVASTYDQVGVPFFQPIAAGLVEQLAPQPGERALDIGCGRGAALVRLAQAVAPTGSVTGLDLAPAMVEASRAALDAAGLSGDVVVADAVAPPLPPASFDIVASSLVLFFLADPLTALRAWTDLLVPGGRLGISTFGPTPAHMERVEAVFEPYLPPAMLDARRSGQAGPFETDAGVEGLLRAAGLRDVRTASLGIPVRFRDGDQWYAWSWSHGQRRMWELIPEADRGGVRDHAVKLLEESRDSAGLIGYDQPVRYTLGVR